MDIVLVKDEQIWTTHHFRNCELVRMLIQRGMRFEKRPLVRMACVKHGWYMARERGCPKCP